MRFFGIAACVIALALTAYSAIVFHAPKIQADIQERAERSLAGIASAPIDVVVDGRFVILRGSVGDDQEREQLIELASDVWGGLGPVDELERLTVMAPYRFEATKNDDGGIVIEGFAPDEDIREQLQADAKSIFGEKADIRITLAKGMPEGDWRGIAGLGMDALATLEQGKLSIDDTDVTLAGKVVDPEDIETIDMFVGAAPEGFAWKNDLVHAEDEVADIAGTDEATEREDPALSGANAAAVDGDETVSASSATPFTFQILKNTDGSLDISGMAPDDDTRQAMIERAKAVAATKPVVADIQIADGMPAGDWPDLVLSTIDAVSAVESGQFDIVDNDVSFSEGEIAVRATEPRDDAVDGQKGESDETATIAASDEESGAVADDGDVDTSPLTTRTGPYVLTVYKTDDGQIGLEGVAPNDAVRDGLLAALKDDFSIDEIKADVDLAEGVPGDDWQDFVVDRAGALKAVKSGSLIFEDYDSHLIGVVETPEDIAITRTRLAAIDSAMTTELNPVDPRPAAALELVVSPDKGVKLWGKLPNDLTEEEVVETLGLRDYEGGLSEDGRGDADRWRRDLTLIGNNLHQFDHVGVKLAEDQSRVEGKLHAKANIDQVRENLKQISDGDQPAVLDISVTELVYDDGAERKNPLTGKLEIYDRGYWLPVVTFSPGLDECRDQTSRILASDKITFLRGGRLLNARGQEILDELASVAIKCLEDGDLTLEIGGHTDSRGAAEMNQELSQARADIVMDSLIERGVDPAAMVATGYGPAFPIADNSTDEGRAQNRRITFEWNESGTEG